MSTSSTRTDFFSFFLPTVKLESRRKSSLLDTTRSQIPRPEEEKGKLEGSTKRSSPSLNTFFDKKKIYLLARGGL